MRFSTVTKEEKYWWEEYLKTKELSEESCGLEWSPVSMFNWVWLDEAGIQTESPQQTGCWLRCSTMRTKWFLEDKFLLKRQQTEIWVLWPLKAEILLICPGAGWKLFCRCPWIYLHVPEPLFFSQKLPLHFSKVSWNFSSFPDTEWHTWFIKEAKWTYMPFLGRDLNC